MAEFLHDFHFVYGSSILSDGNGLQYNGVRTDQKSLEIHETGKAVFLTEHDTGWSGTAGESEIDFTHGTLEKQKPVNKNSIRLYNMRKKL